MSIQGHGIGTRIAYTHTGFRAAQKRAHERIQLARYRRAQCERLKITMAEYEARFAIWCDLRSRMQKRFDAIERKDAQDEFEWMLIEHQKMKVTRRAAAASRAVLGELSSKTPYADKDQTEKLAQNFHRIMPPIT